MAQTGRVTFAAECAGLSRQSASALAQRDPLFAAGWNAAALLARDPLAADIAEKARDGIIETVSRNGEVVATRHRYDGRLSMAVLSRLDKRCDRAEEQGSAHFAIMRRWDEWLELVGKGDEQGALALLDSEQAEKANLGQLGQLPEGANPIPNLPGCDESEYCWRVGSSGDWRLHRKDPLPDGAWMTIYPPPPGFDGYENITWDGLSYYERACTAEEAELLEAHEAAALAEEDAEMTAFAEAQRDHWFAKLEAELDRRGSGELCGLRGKIAKEQQ